MPTITSLTIYPVKSCAGIQVSEAILTGAGLAVDAVYDREWMVVDLEGQFLSQREHPRMALITPRLRADTLELRAPGMLQLDIPLGLPDPELAPGMMVQVWDDQVLAYDCDKVTQAWISKAVGVPCKLVRFHANARRVTSTNWTNGVEAPTMFCDGYPVLLVSEASLQDANARLVAAGRTALPMNRFRPNIVIDGIEAFEEDYVGSFTMGAAQLNPVKPCPRCPMPSIDQATGEFGPDPLDILQAYRRKPMLDDAVCFGMNCIVTAGEGTRLQVGQAIEAELAL